MQVGDADQSLLSDHETNQQVRREHVDGNGGGGPRLTQRRCVHAAGGDAENAGVVDDRVVRAQLCLPLP